MNDKADTTSESQKTPELKLAENFVRDTGKHVFLTGKAGTGKTTFLHHLKGNTDKRMIITAPTGVAAINAGGVTLHSFFQLPFGPFIPGNEDSEKKRQRMFRFSREKLRIIRCLDLLVIDEISMVRADLLDSVDEVLRRLRRNDQPFGGVQLLMIGDLCQLPPVAKPQEWQLLQQYYASPYFFSSHALNRTELVTIELRHIFRQSDAKFIKILNKVRDNQLDADAIGELNRRCIENFVPKEGQGYITLTTHNKNADTINETRLATLKGKTYHLNASVSGDFPEHIYPTPETLVLKEGAQVMFLRNDASGEKRYYNGKIGRIKAIAGEEIRIVCPKETQEIVVEPVQWENIKYSVNEENKEIQEEVIGKFTQYPLKLAWAITIHKSQGLTFEKAVIDAKAAFAQGQVYVALSRCKTLQGMVLSSPLPAWGIKTEEVVLDFIARVQENTPSKNRLKTAKIKYQQDLLLECFDFQTLNNHFNRLVWLLESNAAVVEVFGVTDIQRIQESFRKNIYTVSKKFKQELNYIFKDQHLPESHSHTLDRIRKASGWFQEKFTTIIDDLVRKFYVETDNKEIHKRIDHTFNNFKQEVSTKLAGVQACEKKFSPSLYLRAVSKTELDVSTKKVKKPQPPEYEESDIQHPVLFEKLKDWRTRMAEEKNVARFQILRQRVLIQIVVTLPDNPDALFGIKGIGKKTMENYGDEILAIVREYSKTNQLEKK